MRELPDIDVDTLNAMIANLGRELGCPSAGTVYPPNLVEIDRIPPYIYGYNRGCNPDGLEQYRAGQRWRRRLIAELKRRPEWIAEWLAERDLDRRIRELCADRGLAFRPWECGPWRAPDQLPEEFHPRDSVWAQTLPEAVRLRRQLIRELEAEDARKPPEDLG